MFRLPIHVDGAAAPDTFARQDMIPIVLTILFCVISALASLCMLVLMVASMPNYSPTQYAVIKVIMWGDSTLSMLDCRRRAKAQGGVLSGAWHGGGASPVHC